MSLGFLYSQQAEWYEMMQAPDANIDEVRAAFEKHFETHPKGKSTGWKTFKRWEHFHATRVDENRTILKPGLVYEEIQKWEEHHRADKRSSSQGAWTVLGPSVLPGNGTGQPNGMGRVGAIAFHPTDANIIYVGSPGGGIWKSDDNGATWTDLSTDLTRLGVSSIALHPQNPDTLYIGTGDRDANNTPGLGVWRSVNGGDSWHARNNGMGNRTVYEILIDPTNPNILIASTYYNIYRSIDGGANWSLSMSGHNCKDIAFKPGDPSIVYAVGTKYYQSTNNGQAFTRITNGIPSSSIRMALAVSPTHPNYVYLLNAGSSGFGGLYRSEDSGDSFSARSILTSGTPNILGYYTNGGTGNQGWYDLVITADPQDGQHLFTGGVNVWESFDGGQTWAIVTHWYGGGGNPSVHADDHVLEWSPHTGDIYVGHDGGIHRSTNAGNTWTELSSGLGIAQVYKIGQSATVRDMVVNGYQDNGTAIYYGESGWKTEIGGDGMECLIDYTDPNFIYGELYYGQIRRSTNGGQSFGTIASNGINGINESGGWVTPYLLHPTNPGTMLAGFRNVWRSTSVKDLTGNINWTKISAFSGSYNMVDLAIAPSNPDVVFASRAGSSASNRLYRSTNAMSTAPTWTAVTLPFNSTPKDIEFHSTQHNTLWIAIGNDIYKSTNMGDSWTNTSGTLPNFSLNTIVYDKNSSVDAIYVGMDLGVYYRDNSMSDWISFAQDLPKVEVTELEIFYDTECSDDVLRAATYGRGLWETELKDPGNLAPIACFSPSQITTTCVGAQHTMTDKSSYGPSSWAWTFTPNTVTFLGGTSASSSSPIVSFNNAGTYSVQLLASNAYGQDTKSESSLFTVGSSQSLPLTVDFENTALCGSSSNCSQTHCSLSGPWQNISNGAGDDIDWRVHQGATPSGGTGPNSGAGVTAGKYLYLESNSCTQHTAILESACIDLRSFQQASLAFHLHMYGPTQGSFHVDVYFNEEWILDAASPVIGNQGGSWILKTINLNAYKGHVIKLRLRGKTGGGFSSDMAIDEIVVSGSALVTEVTAFDGKYVEGEGILLSWSSTRNTANEVFHIQRMQEDGSFESIIEQEVKPTTDYSAYDHAPKSGANFYRIAVYTIDGDFDYFNIIEVTAPEEQDLLTVFPNPFDGSFNIKIQTNEYGSEPVEIQDMRGAIVYRASFKLDSRSSTHTVDLSHLTPGIYAILFREKAYRVVKQ